MTKIEIIASKDGQEVGRWSLPPGEYVAGRGEDCDLILSSPTVSGKHARLLLREDRTIEITDLDSSCGTFLGNQPMERSGVFSLPRTFRLADVALEVGQPTGRSNADSELSTLVSSRIELANEADGEGKGSGVAARDLNLERPVFIRWAPEDASCEQADRFLEEARLLARLEHPNVVPIHQLGVNDEGRRFYTLNQGEGQTLASLLDRLSSGDEAARERLPVAGRVTLFLKICDALAFAHSKGVAHGRLHPACVHVGRYGEVLVGGWERADDSCEADDIHSLGGLLFCLLRGLSAASFDAGQWQARASAGVPASLLAIARKAASEDPEDRYETVAELVADIDAWKDGFATEAEGAGFVRQFLLLGLRNKLFAATGLVVAVMASWFVLYVWRSATEARRHVEDLRGHATMFFQVAESHVRRQEWPEALEKIQAAINLNSDDAGFHLLAGDIHLAALDMPAAMEAYGTAEALSPGLSEARQRRERAEGFGAPTAASSAFPFLKAEALRHELVAEGRADVAAGILNTLQTEARRVEKRLLEELRPLDPDVKFTLNEDFTMGLDLRKGQKLASLDSLAGLPFKTLNLNYSPATNLAPLRGMPLESLNLEGAKAADLSPLKGMPLKVLTLTRTAVTNLAPLEGMQLEQLVLMDMHAGDLSPLRGMTNLWYLNLYNAWDVKDLSPLEGLPITDLTLYYTQVTNLAPLSNSKLRVLTAYANKYSDLSPLYGLPMVQADFSHTGVTDISPLRDSPIRILKLQHTRVSEIRTVAALKNLEELILNHSAVKDLRPLIGVPSLKRLTVPEAALQIPANIEIIRRLPRLEQLGSDLVVDERGLVPLKPVAEFWSAYAIARQKKK